MTTYHDDFERPASAPPLGHEWMRVAAQRPFPHAGRRWRCMSHVMYVDSDRTDCCGQLVADLPDGDWVLGLTR